LTALLKDGSCDCDSEATIWLAFDVARNYVAIATLTLEMDEHGNRRRIAAPAKRNPPAISRRRATGIFVRRHGIRYATHPRQMFDTSKRLISGYPSQPPAMAREPQQ
jgi:hypothetical protein